MEPRYRNWRVTGYQRDRRTGARPGSKEEVVVIVEPKGWQWELVMDGDDIEAFGVRHEEGLPVDRLVVNHVSLRDLALMASAFLGRAQGNWDDGFDAQVSMSMAELKPGDVRSLDGSPDDEEFAHAWKEVGPKLPDGTPRRKALAHQFNVSVYTIDKWTQRVRDARPDLIPPARTGRGHRTPLPGQLREDGRN